MIPSMGCEQFRKKDKECTVFFDLKRLIEFIYQIKKFGVEIDQFCETNSLWARRKTLKKFYKDG